MPEFEIPSEFGDADDYLKHITYNGAKKRYGDINEDLKERIDFELETIRKPILSVRPKQERGGEDEVQLRTNDTTDGKNEL